MTCPNCKAIQLGKNRCNRCRYNFETNEVDYQFLSGKTCPQCSSDKVVKYEKWKGTAKQGVFSVMPPLECVACGKIWEPQASAFILIPGLIFCLLVFGLGVVMSMQDFGQGQKLYIGFLAFGGIGAAGCVLRLLKLSKKK